MTLKVDKNNIYVIGNRRKHGLSEYIHDFMENDFSIFVRAKIKKENLVPNKDAFMFSRNGQHSGLSVYIDDMGQLCVRFCYWLHNGVLGSEIKNIDFMLQKEIEAEFNEYAVTCDNIKKVFYFYVNGVNVGVIDYDKQTKCNYSESFIWLGCGSMIMEEDWRNIGEFEYDLIFGLDKKLEIDVITDIAKNYEVKYISEDPNFNLPVLNDAMPYKDNFKIFTNFKNKTAYKIWNMVTNGNQFQFYIENNMYF